MGKPKSPRSTCLRCGEILQWTTARLPKAQEDENAIVEAANAAKWAQARKEAKEAGMHEWQATIEEADLPHKKPRGRESWYHYREEEGTIHQCPKTREWRLYESPRTKKIMEKGGSDGYWVGPTALPKEYCTRTIDSASYYDDTCNRPAKEIWEGREPLCGIHLAHLKKYERQQEKDRERRELESYIESEVTKLIAILKEDHGLDSSVHHRYWYSGGMYHHTPSGKIVVDPKALLDLLEETFG
jgi:hypothetical protein